MTHEYVRHCLRLSDAKRFVERLVITGEQVAMQRNGGRGNRLEFLELLNRWNANGQMSGEYFYCYVAIN